MLHINPYLTFSGNCREAMTFYQTCFGGELFFQTVGESPIADQLPAEMRDLIMHASLTSSKIIIMGSDMTPKGGVYTGNNVSLLIDCSSEEELRDFFEKLAVQGEIKHPVEKTFWGALYGDLNDKYGVQWMLNLNEP
ncbi:MAG: VOC family protein [Bacteroidetes bacterium]|nr:VOC family protein [Bacteroidota bacterium]MBS1683757.1 VOC family protein [Bacteroidota bacterium]